MYTEEQKQKMADRIDLFDQKRAKEDQRQQQIKADSEQTKKFLASEKGKVYSDDRYTDCD